MRRCGRSVRLWSSLRKPHLFIRLITSRGALIIGHPCANRNRLDCSRAQGCGAVRLVHYADVKCKGAKQQSQRRWYAGSQNPVSYFDKTTTPSPPWLRLEPRAPRQQAALAIRGRTFETVYLGATSG